LNSKAQRHEDSEAALESFLKSLWRAMDGGLPLKSRGKVSKMMGLLFLSAGNGAT
jgi:hypothetical protein